MQGVHLLIDLLQLGGGSVCCGLRGGNAGFIVGINSLGGCGLLRGEIIAHLIPRSKERLVVGSQALDRLVLVGQRGRQFFILAPQGLVLLAEVYLPAYLLDGLLSARSGLLGGLEIIGQLKMLIGGSSDLSVQGCDLLGGIRHVRLQRFQVSLRRLTVDAGIDDDFLIGHVFTLLTKPAGAVLLQSFCVCV